MRILLEDSLALYERDLEHENIRRQRSGRKLLQAEYTLEDVRRVHALCEPAQYETRIQLGPHAILRFRDAGHILGSAIIELQLTENEAEKMPVFSGHLGNRDSTLMNDPVMPTKEDVLLMECTYGDRDHRDMGNTLTELETILSEAWQRGGSVMIPSFAIGRAQEILFHLGCLYHQGKLDNLLFELSRANQSNCPCYS